MKIFDTTFKLYAYKNKDRCDLSVRVNDFLVVTFKLTHSELEELTTNETAEFHSEANQYWYATNKKRFQCRRLTIGNNGVDFNFRISYKDWDKLIEEYSTQMTTPQPWDNK